MAEVWTLSSTTLTAGVTTTRTLRFVIKPPHMFRKRWVAVCGRCKERIESEDRAGLDGLVDAHAGQHMPGWVR